MDCADSPERLHLRDRLSLRRSPTLSLNIDKFSTSRPTSNPLHSTSESRNLQSPSFLAVGLLRWPLRWSWSPVTCRKYSRFGGYESKRDLIFPCHVHSMPTEQGAVSPAEVVWVHGRVVEFHVPSETPKSPMSELWKIQGGNPTSWLSSQMH